MVTDPRFQASQIPISNLISGVLTYLGQWLWCLASWYWDWPLSWWHLWCIQVQTPSAQHPHSHPCYSSPLLGNKQKSFTDMSIWRKRLNKCTVYSLWNLLAHPVLEIKKITGLNMWRFLIISLKLKAVNLHTS